MKLRLEVLDEGTRAALRASYRCDCVERHDRRPGRVTAADLDMDPAEGILAGIERATGVRPDGCPTRVLADPFVAAVIRAHRPYVKGELSARHGRSMPIALAAGVDCFDAALNAIEVADMREDKAERDRAAKQPPPDRPTPGTRIRRRR